MGGHAAAVPWSRLLSEDEHAKALDCLMGLTWSDYNGQVVEFLELASREEYGNKGAWDSLQNLVLSRLEADA